MSEPKKMAQNLSHTATCLERRICTAVLFDLDATLFDYTNLREQATVAALEGVVADPKRTGRKLLEVLRPPLTDVLAHLGMPNLRREWDSPEMLKLACVLDDAALRAKFNNLLRNSYRLPGRPSAAKAAGENGRLMARLKSCPSRDTFNLDLPPQPVRRVAKHATELSDDSEALEYRLATYRLAVEWEKSPEWPALRDAMAQIGGRSGASFVERQRVFLNYVHSNANLLTGVEETVAALMSLGADVHVVSEGDTAVQTFKFDCLGLGQLARTCVVTDVTCGVAPVIHELFAMYKDSDAIPPAVQRLYNQLAAYTVKSTAFFCKLLHALVDASPGTTLQQRMQAPHFLTSAEWSRARPVRVVMIGDRYRKDVEPLLRLAAGARAYRVLSGRYRREDPLDELAAEQKPLPHGVFPHMRALKNVLLGAMQKPGEAIARPMPVLPDIDTVDEVLRICRGLSQPSRAILLALRAEAVRQQEAA